VPAGGSADYTLVYKPLTMTTAEGQPHEGSVFFPIPDGSGLLYKLYGQVSADTRILTQLNSLSYDSCLVKVLLHSAWCVAICDLSNRAFPVVLVATGCSRTSQLLRRWWSCPCPPRRSTAKHCGSATGCTSHSTSSKCYLQQL
jgi:hypothetical protein